MNDRKQLPGQSIGDRVVKIALGPEPIVWIDDHPVETVLEVTYAKPPAPPLTVERISLAVKR